MPHHIWTVAKQLSQIQSINLDRFMQVLPAKLTLRDHHPDNSYQRYFSEEALQLEGGVLIASVELRIPSANHRGPGLLNLVLDGACIKKSTLEFHYAPLGLIDVPRGSSAFEQFVYQYTTPGTTSGTTLRFGFPEENPDCLRGITLEWQSH